MTDEAVATVLDALIVVARDNSLSPHQRRCRVAQLLSDVRVEEVGNKSGRRKIWVHHPLYTDAIVRRNRIGHGAA